MTLDAALERLEALADEKVRAQRGGGANQYGVRLGEIRKVAKEIRTDHELAAQLWQTGNVDARLLAILLIKPRGLRSDDLDRMVRSVGSEQVADWLNSNVVRKHPEREALRQRWLVDDDPMAARSGWDLTAQRVTKDPDGLDLAALLDRIESEMGAAPRVVQWTMNNCLAAIGINVPEHRDRALSIGEALGVFRDYPTSPGCTSPFAPTWIGEMVQRQTA